jgi:hypothetical protein
VPTNNTLQKYETLRDKRKSTAKDFQEHCQECNGANSGRHLISVGIIARVWGGKAGRQETEGMGNGNGKERGIGVDLVAPNIITQYEYIGKILFVLKVCVSPNFISKHKQILEFNVRGLAQTIFASISLSGLFAGIEWLNILCMQCEAMCVWSYRH